VISSQVMSAFTDPAQLMLQGKAIQKARAEE
jgi:hypothetical protein